MGVENCGIECNDDADVDNHNVESTSETTTSLQRVKSYNDDSERRALVKGEDNADDRDAYDGEDLLISPHAHR